QKIRKYYRRSSVVIYPPVETELFAQSACEARKDHGYFLIVSRLSAYKKINLAVEAFNKLGWKLVIIGQGPEFKKLHRLAGPNIKLLGYQNRKKTIQYFKNCRAYIQPAEEDFGISTVEAMAAGKPVLALNQGGAREIIKPGLNGEFIQASSAEVLAQGVFKINQNRKNYNPQKIQAFAQKFSSRRFKKELKEFIQKKYYAFRDKDTNR
ncbi:glycosyltransferase, partial [Patescibacteria group bacterium]|nr:glycosyltransferase [Patescibacteria group bacterium]